MTRRYFIYVAFATLLAPVATAQSKSATVTLIIEGMT